MAYLKIANRAASALAADITDTATSLTVTTGEGAKFPSAGDFHITIEDEILKCTARSTDTLTVTRAQEGTTAAAHVANKAVELRITAGVLESRTTWTANKLRLGKGIGIDPDEIIIGSLGATAYVVANDAKTEEKTFAQVLQDMGYPAWVCGGADDDVQLLAADAYVGSGGRVDRKSVV